MRGGMQGDAAVGAVVGQSRVHSRQLGVVGCPLKEKGRENSKQLEQCCPRRDALVVVNTVDGSSRSYGFFQCVARSGGRCRCGCRDVVVFALGAGVDLEVPFSSSTSTQQQLSVDQTRPTIFLAATRCLPSQQGRPTLNRDLFRLSSCHVWGSLGPAGVGGCWWVSLDGGFGGWSQAASPWRVSQRASNHWTPCASP